VQLVEHILYRGALGAIAHRTKNLMLQTPKPIRELTLLCRGFIVAGLA